MTSRRPTPRTRSTSSSGTGSSQANLSTATTSGKEARRDRSKVLPEFFVKYLVHIRTLIPSSTRPCLMNISYFIYATNFDMLEMSQLTTKANKLTGMFSSLNAIASLVASISQFKS